MAGTPDGTRLTEEHRAAQIAIRARLAADVAAAWSLLDPRRLDETTPAWLAVMLALIGAHRGDSARTASRYYTAYRSAELAGNVPPAPAGTDADPEPERHAAPERDRLIASLIATGPAAIKRATDRKRRRPVPFDAAVRASLSRVTGAATRHALNGGRAVLRAAVADDPQTLGWARVTDGDPCYFCAMLSSRGPVYKTSRSALITDDGDAYHDGCACLPEPVYSRTAAWPGRGREFQQLWKDVAEGKGAEGLKAFRAAVEERKRPEQPTGTGTGTEPGGGGTPAGTGTDTPTGTGTTEPTGTDRNPEPAAPAEPEALDALTDEELAEEFAAASNRQPVDEEYLDRLLAEMDRRDAPAGPDPDPLDGVDLTRYPDHVLFDLWQDSDTWGSVTERITAELDRRDRQRAGTVDAVDPEVAPDDDPEAADILAALDADLDAAEAERAERAAEAERERRLEVLVARGWSWAEAYAEAYGLDEDEMRRQELAAAVDAQRQAGETRDQTVRRIYDEWVHLQWLAAEKATNGYLLNAAGVAAGVDPLSLWGGNVERARKYASEELRRWWEDHPRKTLTEFRADLLGRDRDVAAAHRGAGRGNGRDFGL